MNNEFLKRIIGLSDVEKSKLKHSIIDFERWYQGYVIGCNSMDNFPNEIIKDINQVLSGGDKPCDNAWKKYDKYLFFKHGHSPDFDVIETIKFGDDFLGAIYTFSIEPTEDLLDYIKIAEQSELEFEDDTYKLAYAYARAMELERATAIKITDSLNELNAWVNCWMLLSNDFD